MANEQDDILWSGSRSDGWPVKPPEPYTGPPRPSGLWNSWVDLKRNKSDGAPVAAMLAIDAYIREGEAVPPALAQWFNDSLKLYCSDPDTNAKTRVSLDVTFGFKNSKGEAAAMTAYKNENLIVLSTMHMLITEFNLKPSVSARSAISYHNANKTKGWISDLYRKEQRSGKFYPIISGKLGCYFQLIKIAQTIELRNDRDALVSAGEKFRIERLGNIPKKDVITFGLNRGLPSAAGLDVISN